MGVESKDMQDRLIQARKKQGFTQEELAERMNVSVSAIAKIECGLRDPSIDMLIAFSKNLNITIDYILFGMSVMEYKCLKLLKELEEKANGLEKSKLHDLRMNNSVQEHVQSLATIENDTNPQLLSAIKEVLNILAFPTGENFT